MTAILFSRAIGPVAISVVLSEAPESVLSITEIPVEDGSKITDHAHSEPFRIALDVATPTLAVTYGALVEFQKRRVPFTYVSGFGVHRSLLLRSISPERDMRFADVFKGRLDLQEIKIVSSASAPGDGGEGAGGGNTSSGGRTTEAHGGEKRAGGESSRRAAAPAASRASDPVTRDRAAGTTTRGDVKTEPVASPKAQSLLFQLTGGQ